MNPAAPDLRAMAWAAGPVFTGHRGAVYALCAGTAPRTFLSGGGDGLVVRWQLDRPDVGELVANVNAAVFALHLGADGRLLHIGDEHGGLHVIDLQERREVLLDHTHRKGIFRIASLADGRLVCAGGDGLLGVWRMNGHGALVPLRQLPLSEGKLRDLAVSPDGNWIAVACGDGTVRVLDTTDLNERYTLHGAEAGASCVAWHPHKPVLIAGGKDGHLRFWHAAEDFRVLRTIAAHSGTVYAIAFSADGTVCATVSRDKTAKLWDVDTFDAMARLDRTAGGRTHSVNAVLWCGADALLTASDDGRICAWSISD